LIFRSMTGVDRLRSLLHADKKKRLLVKIAPKTHQRASEARKLFPILVSQIFAATSGPPSRAMALTQIGQFRLISRLARFHHVFYLAP
jgi:hypothetical protein